MVEISHWKLAGEEMNVGPRPTIVDGRLGRSVGPNGTWQRRPVVGKFMVQEGHLYGFGCHEGRGFDLLLGGACAGTIWAPSPIFSQFP